MELNKWYKGDELPDRECDCVIIWNAKWDSPFEVILRKERINSLGYTQTTENILGEEIVEFIALPSGESIPQEDIIRWMPIEFPKEVS